MSEINGFLLLDKDMNISSNSALYPIKKLLPRKYKVGHTGTLDPNATGLLVVALGRATKFIEYLKSNEKIYFSEFEFGKKTNTADIWGEVIKTDQKVILEKEFSNKISEFIGNIDQIPPMYSAIKKDGKPLYKFARDGIEVQRNSRKVSISSIEVVSFVFPFVKIRITCSRGTYIRTLIEDIAESLGTLATMTSLRREKSDGFLLDNSAKICEIISLEDINKKIIDIESAFLNLPALKLDSKTVKDLKNGVKISLIPFMTFETKKGDLLRLYDENNFVALIANDGRDLRVEKWV